MMIGASSHIWVSPFSTARIDQLKHVKEIGFDIYEIAVEDFHACANDRRTPGEDHFNWREIRKALNEADYNGPVVIESFTPEIKEIAKAVSLWRPLAESPDRLARNGLHYLRSVFG